MAEEIQVTTLGEAVKQFVLERKLLIAPSHSVGHQWIEALVRRGTAAVNLHATIVNDLALTLATPELVAQSLTVASRQLGPLVIDAVWKELKSDGYFGQLEPSTELSAMVFETVLDLRLAGLHADQLDGTAFESKCKQDDLTQFQTAYEAFLSTHRLVDEADLLRMALGRLAADPQSLGDQTLLLIPSTTCFAGLQRQLINAVPASSRFSIRHPADAAVETSAADQIVSGANQEPGSPGNKQEPPTTVPTTVHFFRALGEVNEVREVLRRCLAAELPLDHVELLVTDSDTYVPLIYATARQYFSDPDRPDGVPVTFAEGLAAGVSRPGRALVAWQEWVQDGYPQRGLVEMLSEGLLEIGDERFGGDYLARLLRPLAIGLGADNYLPQLDAQIRVEPVLPPTPSDPDELERRTAADQRKRAALQVLRGLTERLLRVSREYSLAEPGPAVLLAAETFITELTRPVNELDHLAAEALVDQLRQRRGWLERLGLALDLRPWLSNLAAETRVLIRAPRPGHVHVAPLRHGGHTGRPQLFVMGLDDRRFPGAALQDPVLLDRERGRLSAELETSARRMRDKTAECLAALSRPRERLTLSWSCRDLVDDRELFPSPVLLSLFRQSCGLSDANLESLNSAVGPPRSFAPDEESKALDESERWLWRLTDEALRGTNQRATVEGHFPHLARGSRAERERCVGFGPFNGHVPQAGFDLQPFAEGAKVLSASALETAGRCPRAYFFRQALKLYAPDDWELDLDRWLDAAQFGLLLHDVFRRFLAELSQSGRRPELERDQARLAEILREAVASWREEFPPPNENAFRLQYLQLVRTSFIFLSEEERFCGTSQPRFFEVAVGLPPVAGGSPLDDAEPATIPLGDGQSIRVLGQIDRVDEIGPGQYTVWDYKISSGYGYDRSDPFRQGRRMQGVLYVPMVEAALRARLDASAAVERFGYFFPSVRAHGLRMDWPAETLCDGREILLRICRSIGNGAFPATDDPDDCRYCDYSSICGNVEQTTSLSKGLLERDELVPLQPFRELRRGQS